MPRFGDPLLRMSASIAARGTSVTAIAGFARLEAAADSVDDRGRRARDGEVESPAVRRPSAAASSAAIRFAALPGGDVRASS